MPPDLALAYRLMHEHFGFSSLRSGQERLVAAGMSGRDALGVLPTGGGKSLCYQVPALALPSLTLVLSPLISLMEDQAKRARTARIPAAYLTSGLSGRERQRVLQEAVDGKLSLLFAAPERLETPGFVEALRTTQVSLVAVDEAHCISEWVFPAPTRVLGGTVPDVVPFRPSTPRRFARRRAWPRRPRGSARMCPAWSESSSDRDSSAAPRSGRPAR